MSTAFIAEIIEAFGIPEADAETARSHIIDALKKHGPQSATKPKEPTPVYQRFCATRRDAIREQLKSSVAKEFLAGEVGLQLSKEWHALGDEGQKPFFEADEADRKAFHEANPDYKRTRVTVPISHWQMWCAEEYQPRKGTPGVTFDGFKNEHYTLKKDSTEFKESYDARRKQYLTWCATQNGKTDYTLFMKQYPWVKA